MNSARSPQDQTRLRDWRVAGGIIRREAEILIVENLRRDQSRDWTTPGGVIDPGEETLEALSREVAEETGLSVLGWNSLAYRVVIEAPELGFLLTVEAYEATGYEGEIEINDPDQIVTVAEFVPLPVLRERVSGGDRWVSEPLISYLDELNPPSEFRYLLEGETRATSVARRIG